MFGSTNSYGKKTEVDLSDRAHRAVSLIASISKLIARWRKKLSDLDYEKYYYFSEILVKIGLLLGGIFAYYQFSAAQEDKRIERSIAYFDRFERGDVADARRTIRGKIRPYYQQFAALSEAGVRKEDHEQMILLLVEEDSDGNLADALEQVADFFDGLKLCVEVELCAREIVVDYFCPSRSNEIWEDFAPFFVERRKNNSKFGESLEWCASVGVDQ